MTNSKEYDDILSTLCTFSLLYNTGHSLQQLERIAKIKSQQTSTIMGEKMYNRRHNCILNIFLNV